MGGIDIKLYLMWSSYKYCLIHTYQMFLLWWWIVRGKSYLETIEESLDFFWDNLSFNNKPDF